MNSISKVLFLSAAAVLLAVVAVCLSDESEALDYYEKKVNFDPDAVTVYYSGAEVEPLTTIKEGRSVYIYEKPGYHNLTINGISHSFGEEYVIWPEVRDSGMVIEVEKKEYSINFSFTGEITGSMPESIIGKEIGSVFEILPTSFSRTGYTMIGWNESGSVADSTLSEGEYNLDAEFITNVFGSNSTVTLYPVWTLNTYSISLKTERGHGIGWAAENGSFVSSYSVESDEISLPVPEPDDRFHTFINWEDPEGNPVSKIAAGSTGNLDLKAVWIEKSFPITITINGKTASYDMTISSTMPEAEPEAGFELKGWYYKDSDGNEVLFESMSQIDEGMSIYAVFVPVPDDPMEIAIGAGALILFFLITTIYAYTRN